MNAFSSTTSAPHTAILEKSLPSRVSTLAAADLVEYPRLSPSIQRLIQEALTLTQENLAYKYGSDDPAAGGMDCSGTIHYLLAHAGIEDVPRDSSEFYVWVWKKDLFQSVVSTSPGTFELGRLKPGDLLFWTGTYRITRDPPVTHVMIYLGTSRITGRRVMVGASDGRTFNDQPRSGVSVFDFKIPSASSPTDSRFIGYSPIPGLDEATRTAASKN